MSEKGWKLADMKIQKRDAFVSVFIMFILSFAVMACAEGTLFVKNMPVDNAIDMVQLMEPLAGRLAVSMFVAGIVCAGLSSLFPIIVLGPWLICDYLGVSRDLTKPWARALALVTTLCGMVVPVFGGRPVFVMLFSQSLAIVSTPLVIALMMILLNKPKVMGEHVASVGRNLLLFTAFIFSLIVAVVAIMGIVQS